ncbi:MAG: transglutaminase-like domain-containing protein [Chitinophagaceae bacterium]|nr:transglutaminase-like domain-containing protein [Chitinophagaceae bacterium]
MLENEEINALFYLIEDPDEKVFDSVSTKLISMGKGILPNLEHLWENTPDEALQRRIEMIIHKLHFQDLVKEFTDWRKDSPDLLQGALLVSKYMYPDLSHTRTFQEVERLRRNIWMELNSYLTPMEESAVISAILFNYYKLQGNSISYDIPDDFLLPKLIENKRGNAISTGILYLILAQMLDVPIAAIKIPRQFILAYFVTEYEYPDPVKKRTEQIQFYIDPLNGQVYSQKDVEEYFKRNSRELLPEYFKPMNTVETIRHLLEELGSCFTKENNRYKKEDLITLAKKLDE